MTREPTKDAMRDVRLRNRSERRSVDDQVRREASERLAALALDHFHTSGLSTPPGRLGVYMPADGEISPLPIGAGLMETGWSVWIPVVRSDTEMDFARLEIGEDLVENRFGISEPARPTERCTASELDMIVVPCVAFDRYGHRLGMGAGFYDRALSGTRPGPTDRDPSDGKPVLVGVGFDFQFVDRLAADPWDVPMDLIVTDQRVVSITDPPTCR